jgi:hypothetical protein
MDFQLGREAIVGHSVNVQLVIEWERTVCSVARAFLEVKLDRGVSARLPLQATATLGDRAAGEGVRIVGAAAGHRIVVKVGGDVTASLVATPTRLARSGDNSGATRGPTDRRRRNGRHAVVSLPLYALPTMNALLPLWRRIRCVMSHFAAAALRPVDPPPRIHDRHAVHLAGTRVGEPADAHARGQERAAGLASLQVGEDEFDGQLAPRRQVRRGEFEVVGQDLLAVDVKSETDSVVNSVQVSSWRISVGYSHTCALPEERLARQGCAGGELVTEQGGI